MKSGLLRFLEFRIGLLDGEITDEFRERAIEEAKNKMKEYELSVDDVTVCTVESDDDFTFADSDLLRGDMDVEDQVHDEETKRNKRSKTSKSCCHFRASKLERNYNRESNGIQPKRVQFDKAHTKVFWKRESPLSIRVKKERHGELHPQKKRNEKFPDSGPLAQGKVRVACWNVQSWNTNKQPIVDSIFKEKIGVCFLLESRIKFMKSVGSNSIIHYTACGEKSNGMAVFVQPKILDMNGFVQVLHSDEYRITLKVSNTIVSGIYFPLNYTRKKDSNILKTIKW